MFGIHIATGFWGDSAVGGLVEHVRRVKGNWSGMNVSVESLAVDKFKSDLDEEVGARCEEQIRSGDELPLDVALAQVALEYLEEESVIPGAEICAYADTVGRGRCAITAYSVSEDSSELYLFLSTYFPSPGSKTSLTASELANLAGRAARFFFYASQGNWGRFSGIPETMDAAKRIHSVLDRLSMVHVYIITNVAVRDRDIQSMQIHDIPVGFEVVDPERLYRLSQTAMSRQDIAIDFVELMGRPLACLEVTPRASDYDTYLTILSGELLFNLYERFGQRLLEFNVRSYLQAKGQVNKGIRDTLRAAPDRFMAYNNGIVATADEVEVGAFHGETAIWKIRGLQIVNGAQTTASIHRAKKVDKIDLSRVSVAAKITKVVDERLQEFVPLISKFANVQNVIQVADLSANNDFHIEMERLSQITWCPGEETRWFYERARGAYQDALHREGSTPAKRREFKQRTPVSHKITKTDLAKYLLAWMGRPDTVSLGAQKNFAIFMSELPALFPDGWKPDRAFYRRCVAQAIVYRACERAVRLSKFPAYRANISTYTYALLSHIASGEIDFEWIWESQGVSLELSTLLGGWAHTVDKGIRESAGNRNITEWCKKADCWEAVRSTKVTFPDPPPPEIAGAKEPGAAAVDDGDGAVDGSRLNAEGWSDEEAVEACVQHDAATWARLHYWGAATQSLDYYERGVSHTLSEYAAGGWVRKPSVKQARIGMRALRKARDAKLI